MILIQYPLTTLQTTPYQIHIYVYLVSDLMFVYLTTTTTSKCTFNKTSLNICQRKTEKRMLTISEVCPRYVWKHLPLSPLHNLAVLSKEPVNTLSLLI